MKITEEIIRNEVAIIKAQFDIAISDIPKSEKIFLILTEAKKSPFFELSAVWHCEQILYNNLPEGSSGAYATALIDFDNLVSGLGIEDDEVLYKLAEELMCVI
jgi:hypothetical protein